MVVTDGIHIAASSIKELHQFALRMGIKRHWYHGAAKQHPHYDRPASISAERLQASGARLVASKDLLSVSRSSNPPRICRCGCGQTVKWPRRNWFSQGCVDAWRLLHDWGFIRQRVLERDKGICDVCGRDCLAVQFQGWRLWNSIRTKRWPGGVLLPSSFLKRNPGFRLGRDYWEVDHIVPRIRGGTHELKNLRSLCTPCHRLATARLAGERKRERRAAREGCQTVMKM